MALFLAKLEKPLPAYQAVFPRHEVVQSLAAFGERRVARNGYVIKKNRALEGASGN